MCIYGYRSTAQQRVQPTLRAQPQPGRDFLQSSCAVSASGHDGVARLTPTFGLPMPLFLTERYSCTLFYKHIEPNRILISSSNRCSLNEKTTVTMVRHGKPVISKIHNISLSLSSHSSCFASIYARTCALELPGGRTVRSDCSTMVKSERVTPSNSPCGKSVVIGKPANTSTRSSADNFTSSAKKPRIQKSIREAENLRHPKLCYHGATSEPGGAAWS